MNKAIWIELPSAMPIVMSTRFLRAITIADPLSAAPPTIATNTMPMNTCVMPSAWPVPSAAPTRISLIHAASSEAPTRLPTARGTLQCVPSASPSPWPPLAANAPGWVFSMNTR